MFKIICDVHVAEYDMFISKLFREADQHGIKLPPIANEKMLRMLPKDAKNKLLIATLNNEKKRLINMIQSAAAKYAAEMHISDLNIYEGVTSGDVQLEIKVDEMDYDAAAGRLSQLLLEDSDLPQILGENYSSEINIENVCAFIQTEPIADREYFVLKSMSVKKAVIIQKSEETALENGIVLKINGVRFLIQNK